MFFNLAETLSRAQKGWILFAVDIGLIAVSYLVAALLLSGTEPRICGAACSVAVTAGDQ